MLRFLLACVLCLGCVASSWAAPETTAPAPKNVQRGFEILQRVRRESKDKDYAMRALLAAELAPYDVDLALKLADDEGAASEMETAFIIIEPVCNYSTPAVAR